MSELSLLRVIFSLNSIFSLVYTQTLLYLSRHHLEIAIMQDRPNARETWLDFQNSGFRIKVSSKNFCLKGFQSHFEVANIEKQITPRGLGASLGFKQDGCKIRAIAIPSSIHSKFIINLLKCCLSEA